VNGVGYEAGNESVSADRDLPWLQDVADQNVWTTWAPVYRDVIILDAEGRHVASYNLTTYSLGDTINYEDLKKLLVDEATKTRPIDTPQAGPE
jgi:hypothetical protein